jgi:hypothetical protein
LEGRWIPSVGISPPQFGGPISIHCDNSEWNTVTVDHDTVDGGRAVIKGTGLSGVAYYDWQYSSIVIWGGTVGTTSNILANAPGKPVTVNHQHEGDVLNLGGDDLGNQNQIYPLKAKVTLANTFGVHSKVTVHDENDTFFQTVTVKHYWSSSGFDGHQVDGLPTYGLDFIRAVTRELTINTGKGGAAVTVESSEPLAFGGAITLSGHAPAGSGLDSVTVGSSSHAENVKGILTVKNPPGYTAIVIDNSLYNGSNRTVTLDTYMGADGSYGRITGVVPSQTINFKHGDTRSLALHTGKNGAYINVFRTGQLYNDNPIMLFGHDTDPSSPDIVNVGNLGSVQEIYGSVRFRSAAVQGELTVDDSADPGNQTVSLDTYSDGERTNGRISGLTPAPATISYRCSELHYVYVATGAGQVAVNVLATGVLGSAATLILMGNSNQTTVNVGNAMNGVQDIWGPLLVQNSVAAGTALNIDDCADTLNRNVTESLVDDIAGIAGLAPASISFGAADVGTLGITTGSGMTTFVGSAAFAPAVPMWSWQAPTYNTCGGVNIFM